MEFDLGIAIISTGVVGLLAFFAGSSISAAVGRGRSLLFAEAVLLALAFAWLYSGRLVWARLLPDSAVLYWSNWMPALLLFTAGLARHAEGLRHWRRPITVSLLAALAVAYVVMPVARPWFAPVTTATSEGWRDHVCLQSHPSTCGAAAAATLMHLKGLPGDEKTMTRACLTSRYGTVPLGLYRGLAFEAGRFGRSARVASTNPKQWDELDQLPNVALVHFDRGGAKTPLYRLLGRRGLERDGEGHAVVVIKRTSNGRWLIADPAVGRVQWTDEEFLSRFSGDAIYLD